MANTNNPTFVPDVDGLYTMEAAKKLGTPGLRFRAPTGSVGTILPTRSDTGKLQAEMTCIDGGPNHVRLVSDWHQCGRSPEMQKKTKRKPAQTTTTTTVAQSSEDVVAAAEAVRTELQNKLVQAKQDAGLTNQTVEVTPF